MKLPTKHRDLRRLVLRRDAIRILAFALWILLWLLGAHSYNQNRQAYPPERRILGWRLLVLMAAVSVVGFFLFRVYKLFTERACIGVIESSGLSHAYRSSADPGRGMQYDFRLNTTLTVRLSSGKKMRLRFEQKNGFYQYYREGTRIGRFRGLPYPVRLCDDGKEGYVCVACGCMHPSLLSHCEACGHTLIDPCALQGKEE